MEMLMEACFKQASVSDSNQSCTQENNDSA